MERTLRLFYVSTALIASVAASAAPDYRLHTLPVSSTRFLQGTPGNIRISNADVVSFAAFSFDKGGESFTWQRGVKTNTAGLGQPGMGYNYITDGGILHNQGGYFDGTKYVEFPELSPFSFYDRRVLSFNDNLNGVGTIISSTPRNLAYLYVDGQGFPVLGPDTTTAAYTDLNNRDEAILIGDGFSGDKAYIHNIKTDQVTDITPMLQGRVFGGYSNLQINDLGVIAGTNWAFYPDGNGGYTPKQANGLNIELNNKGQLVGLGGVDGGTFHDGQTTWFLRDLVQFPTGATFIDPEDINDNGWIVGTYAVGSDVYAFAMEPVPEPATMLVLAGGLLSIARRRRNRK